MNPSKSPLSLHENFKPLLQKLERLSIAGKFTGLPIKESYKWPNLRALSLSPKELFSDPSFKNLRNPVITPDLYPIGNIYSGITPKIIEFSNALESLPTKPSEPLSQEYWEKYIEEQIKRLKSVQIPPPGSGHKYIDINFLKEFDFMRKMLPTFLKQEQNDFEKVIKKAEQGYERLKFLERKLKQAEASKS